MHVSSEPTWCPYVVLWVTSDGDLDLLNKGELHLNNGFTYPSTASFTQSFTSPLIEDSYWGGKTLVAAADMDNDGDIDLMLDSTCTTICSAAQYKGILRGDGHLSFTDVSTAVPGLGSVCYRTKTPDQSGGTGIPTLEAEQCYLNKQMDSALVRVADVNGERPPSARRSSCRP